MAYENEIGNIDIASDTGNEVDEHKYEQLGRPRPTRERMEMEASDGHIRKGCRMPPWWGWLLIVIGLLILCAVIVSMVIFLTSKYHQYQGLSLSSQNILFTAQVFLNSKHVLDKESFDSSIHSRTSITKICFQLIMYFAKSISSFSFTQGEDKDRL